MVNGFSKQTIDPCLNSEADASGSYDNIMTT